MDFMQLQLTTEYNLYFYKANQCIRKKTIVHSLSPILIMQLLISWSLTNQGLINVSGFN